MILSTAYGMVKETLNWLVDTSGVEVVVVNITFPIDSASQITHAVSDVLAAHGDVKLCIFSHISSMVRTNNMNIPPRRAYVLTSAYNYQPAVIEPVADLSAIAHTAGAIVLVDGAHAPGQINVDVTVINADFYLGNCHKWLYAPKGTAFLWVSPAHQTSVSPGIIFQIRLLDVLTL